MTTSQYITIPLTKGYSTIIDEIDSDLMVSRWHVQEYKKWPNKYATRLIRINDKVIVVAMHRVILSRILGRELNAKEFVDHVDGDGLNNLRSNLRLATFSENRQNSIQRKPNKTGYKGVAKNGKNRFQALICFERVVIYLGTYKTPEDAAQAYNAAAVKYFGEFAQLNVIPKKD